jgi:cyclic beta-1,2-glucan synthetase
MLRDLSFGLTSVLILSLGALVYAIGDAGVPAPWIAYPAAALLGCGVSLLASAGIAGRKPSPPGLFADVLVTALLAASASSAPLWKAPSAWGDLLRLSAFGAALFCVLYHTANTISLAARRRRMGILWGGILLTLPFAAGCLLGLQPESLAESVGRLLVGWVPFAWETVAHSGGRLLLLLAFNEFLVNAFSLGLRRMPLTGWRARLCLLACSAGAVMAPSLADFGSATSSLTGCWATRSAVILASTALSQGLLWAEVFLLTGVMLDGLNRKGPTWLGLMRHAIRGLTNGAIVSGVFMAVAIGFDAVAGAGFVRAAFRASPILWAAVSAGLAFPLARAIVESFDGSQSFARRVARAFLDPVLYARGALAGGGIALAIAHGLTGLAMGDRAGIGFVVGAAAYGGVSLLRDGVYVCRRLGRIQSWRFYTVELALGGCIGAALFFYLDAGQIEVVRQRLAAYASFDTAPVRFDVYPIVSKWGYLLLGTYTGGAKLLFNQALMGAVCWAIAAWLFAVNRAFLLALFQRHWTPVRDLATRRGFAGLLENTLFVMRWGLWMSPIIATFLWQMPTPTWFNQDGAIHTLTAAVRTFTLDPAAFTRWSLDVFLWIVAYGAFRVLIWLDHMGLRVATLVNLSFIGLDRLDERVARFIGPAATARFIPESVKRFATWMPLLIPYYMPTGADWDYVWNTANRIMATSGDWVASLRALPAAGLAALGAGTLITATAIATGCRLLAARAARRREPSFALANRRYEVTVTVGGEVRSRLTREDYDVSRRSYEGLDPAGRALFLVDAAEPHDSSQRWWPVVGNWPADLFPKSAVTPEPDAVRVAATRHGIRATVRISLTDGAPAAEVWEVELHNDGATPRDIKLVPYLEWVLNTPGADRGHSQYNRLFPEVEYASGLHAVLARHRDTKKVGFLAADVAPEGFLAARVDFIGRAASLWAPCALQTLRFHAPRDTGAAPDFDPAACLLIGAKIPPGGRTTVRLMIGCASSRPQARGWIRRVLVSGADKPRPGTHSRPVYHGRRPPGVPPPYVEMTEAGRTMRVLTPYTPLPYDHTMANAAGHVLCVTNRGLQSSASVNAQQNCLTTDWADIVTRELPSEAFYLFDPDDGAWYSPTYEPLRDTAAQCEAEFSLDGTATFRMGKGTVATELTVFVPPSDPVGLYLLSITNRSDRPRRLRLAPYFQIALANMPENAGSLSVRADPRNGAVYFRNPRNTFRTGPAFAAIAGTDAEIVTRRSRFFGAGRPVFRPLAVEQGRAAGDDPTDAATVAAFLATVTLPPGATQTVAMVLGQAEDRARARALVARYRSVEAVRSALAETREWWRTFLRALSVETSRREFDRHLPWLQYQALTERIRARKGFYQSSGAFGFRDQLQDTVNLIWADATFARRQLLLHAAQQFEEGDVAHWFFLQQNGQTGLLNRSQASDNSLWLVWGVSEYVRMTGDESLLDEPVSYLRAQTPLPPLPGARHGMVGFAHRTTREEPVYRHCLRALNRMFRWKLGRHGLPLMGTGDWNDGLDAIGRKGRGESVWLGLFLYRVAGDFLPHIEARNERRRAAVYRAWRERLRLAIEATWRGDRYLRAIHDSGAEIGAPGSPTWAIDALIGAWAVLSGINPDRGRIAFDTAIRLLEKDRVILLGWPPLPENSTPSLGRSSRYPDGIRENGMYCHGVQWLVGAARLLSEQAMAAGDREAATRYRDTAARLWWKISPLSHATPDEIERYGGQPNKQAADLTTGITAGRMIWNGYTGAAGWMLRQACEGVLGFRLEGGIVRPPRDLDLPRGGLVCHRLARTGSALTKGPRCDR